MTYLTPSLQDAIKTALAGMPANTTVEELTAKLEDMGWRNVGNLSPSAVTRFA